MRIRIDGTNTVNKGAELMLYAVLAEIEKTDKRAIVEYNMDSYVQDRGRYPIQTNLDFRTMGKWKDLCSSLKITGLLRRMGLSFRSLSPYSVGKFHPKIDILMDASGFKFSDQWNISPMFYKWLSDYYAELKAKGTYIVFLPQAFGPFRTDMGKKVVAMIDRYADIVFARDIVSYNYLIDAGCSKEKTLLYPDFTAPVKGTNSEQYQNLKGGVGIVPNYRMVDKGGTGTGQYFKFLISVIEKAKENGKQPYLLNHESKGDAKLCHEVNARLEHKLPVVDNANGLDVKGIIANSYMLVTSRFHGVASALNSGVPCLATSWSHKYEELFKDFGQSDCLLDSNNIEDSLVKISSFLEPTHNAEIKENLLKGHAIIKAKNEEMWKLIWEKYRGQQVKK